MTINIYNLRVPGTHLEPGVLRDVPPAAPVDPHLAVSALLQELPAEDDHMLELTRAISSAS